MLLTVGSQANVPLAKLKESDNTVVRSYIWGLDVAGDVNYSIERNFVPGLFAQNSFSTALCRALFQRLAFNEWSA